MSHHPYRHATHWPQLSTLVRCLDCGRRMNVAALYSSLDRAPRFQRGWTVCAECTRSRQAAR
jgi:hypothetical protein